MPQDDFLCVTKRVVERHADITALFHVPPLARGCFLVFAGRLFVFFFNVSQSVVNADFYLIHFYLVLPMAVYFYLFSLAASVH